MENTLKSIPSYSCFCHFIIWFFLITVTINAQSSKIDSLKNELVIHVNNDSIRVNVLNALAFSYFSSDIPKSLEYLAEAHEIAEAIQFKKGKARSIYIKGITEAVQSNFNNALVYYDEALKLYKNINSRKGIANCYNAIGITYKNKGELRKSITYFKKAIVIEEEIGSDNLSASLINLGSSVSDLGEFDEAISYLKKAYTIAEADGNAQRVAYSLNNLGTIFMDQGNYPLALDNLKKSLLIDEKIGDSLGIANHLSNIGEVYTAQKNYDTAMHFFNQSLEMHSRINRKQGVSKVLNMIGNLLMKKNDYNNALDHFLKSLSIAEEIEAANDTPYILNNIGSVYLELKDYSTAKQFFEKAKKIGLANESKLAVCDTYIGLARTFTNLEDYKTALDYGLKAKEISGNYGFFDSQKESSEVLFKVYKAMGNYKKALESHQQYKTLNDSLFNKANVEKIAQLEYEYRYKQALDSANIRELKLTKTVLSTSQDLAKSRQNYLWAVIGILVISILLSSVVFYQKLKTIKIKNQNIVTEQKLLRSQMTPHFIFNSLSVLQGMILDKQEKKSVTYLSKFSKLLRIVLENSRDKVVPLIQELDALDNYMILQNMDADPPYSYSLLVDENIDIHRFLIPPMLIQPFIENAIEHAFPTDQTLREIEVHLSFKARELRCTIADNGIGIDATSKSSKTRKKSLATTITNERLELLAKDFKVEGGISIEDRKNHDEQGTKVTLIIPYKTTENT